MKSHIIPIAIWAGLLVGGATTVEAEQEPLYSQDDKLIVCNQQADYTELRDEPGRDSRIIGTLPHGLQLNWVGHAIQTPDKQVYYPVEFNVTSHWQLQHSGYIHQSALKRSCDIDAVYTDDILKLAEELQQVNGGETKEAVFSTNAGYDGSALYLDKIPELQDIQPLSKRANLLVLSLSKTEIEDLTILEPITKLQRLNLEDTPIADIRSLKKLANLQELNLADTAVTDITPLAMLTELQKLNFGGTQIRDITPLKQTTKLQELSLYFTPVSDLKPLSTLSDLRKLHLGYKPGVNLSHVSELTKLEELYINSTRTTDISPLSALFELRVLDLADTRVTDLMPLTELSNLRELNIRRTRITDLSPLDDLVDNGLKIEK